MSARSSGRHWEHDDPEDVANLELMGQTIARRIRLSPDSAQKMSVKVGRSRMFVDRMMQRGPGAWHYNSWQNLCTTVQAHPRLRITTDIEQPESVLWSMAQTSTDFLGIGAMDLLKEVRKAKGWTTRSVAADRGVVYSAVFAVEESDNPCLKTIARYARWMGCRADFGITPWTPDGT